MKNTLLIILCSILNLHLLAQISFEKGYFINNDDQRIECEIKNIDWKNNPTEFEYRLTSHSEKKKATIKMVKEFGISNVSKYSRERVRIDRSTSLRLIQLRKVGNYKYIALTRA